MSALFLHCRAGFENECAAEIQHRAQALGIFGYCKAKPRSAYVVFQPQESEAAAQLHDRLAFASLIFVRQWFIVAALCKDLPVDDRIGPLSASLEGLPHAAQDLHLETPDTNEAKTLGTFLRSFSHPMRNALQSRRLLGAGDRVPPIRVHVCFLTGTAAYAGYARIDNSAPWPMGIARLKLPRAAPSRAVLKLEEALLTFLSSEEREAFLQPGMVAVDLGAAPGGWSWLLARKHLRVHAVDNGPMDESVLETGLVEHVREDGFSYRPPRPVDWMVSDIADKPMRVAALVATWVARGYCRHAVFNLKLPMKQRYAELERCLQKIRATLEDEDCAYHLACKQLYHDREEVTGYVRRL